PKKLPQTELEEDIGGHRVAGHEPILFKSQGGVAWTTMERLHERFSPSCEGLEVLAHDLETSATRWTPVRSVIPHRFTGEMLTTDQKWGVVETTPNHSIYDRSGATFYPEELHEVLAARRIQSFAPVGALFIDVAGAIPGFVTCETRIAAGGGPMTRPSRPGWARLGLPRHATETQSIYDVATDGAALKDLITVLVWYATEGHVNGRNGGSFAEAVCGTEPTTRRLPDFIFNLPPEFL